MAHNLDTAALRAFVVVTETGSMTRAAALLNLTQGAVSQQVRRLEEQLGQRLFEREHRTLSLTSAGERLLPRATAMLEHNDAIWAAMTAPEVEGEVRLGVPYDIVPAIIPPILKSFAREWPRLRVNMVTDPTASLLRQLEAGALDLCLTTERSPDARAEILTREPLVWVGAPGGSAHQRNPLPLALGDPTCAFRAAVLEALGETALDWTTICTTSNRDSMSAMVAADLGVAPLLRISVPPELRALDNNECALPSLPPFAIALHLPAATLSVGAEKLAEHIRHAFSTRLAA